MPEREGKAAAADRGTAREIFIKSKKGKRRAVTPDHVKEGKTLRRKKLLKDIIQTIASLAVTVAAGKWAFAYAYAERGYHAIGGELLVPVLAYLFTYYAVGIVLNIWEEKRRKNRKRQRTISTGKIPATYKKEA